MRKILVLPDVHFGSEDKPLLARVVQFIGDYQPDQVIQVGDFLDCKAPARWSRATVEEFADTLQGELDASAAWLTAVRAVYNGPIALKAGNHDQRLEVYLKTRAPALAGLDAMRIEDLLRLTEFDVSWHRRFIQVAPGWVVAHGHEGSLSRYAGGTAIGIARKIGKNVVCGHSHRAGVITESVGYGGTVRHLTGMEVGNMINMRKAGYLPTGSANWQSALGLLIVTDRYVTPVLVPVLPDGSFVVEGTRYH